MDNFYGKCWDDFYGFTMFLWQKSHMSPQNWMIFLANVGIHIPAPW
jgi:hypothetical protein